MSETFGEHFKEIPLGQPSRPAGGAMYPEEMTTPMRAELTDRGVTELTNADDVAREIDNAQGTVAVLINSVCGCAAGAARPGYLLAKEASEAKPDKFLTAFAGVHKEAVDAVRERVPAPPSSPCIVLFKDGKPVTMMHRSDIEVRDANGVASVLGAMFGEFCVAPSAS